MSSTITVKPTKGVRGIGLFSMIAGIVFLIAGLGTWIMVTSELADEKITVSDDASFFAGRDVNGPLTAFAQAEVISKHALEASDGKTYAQLDQDDPVRETVMDASFLRASLYTSVVAFGVAALVMGLGVLFLFVGIALRRLAGGSHVAVETSLTSGGGLSEGSGRRSPSHAAPETTLPPAEPVGGVEPAHLAAPSGPTRASATSSVPPASPGVPAEGTLEVPPDAAPPTSPGVTPPTGSETGRSRTAKPGEGADPA